MKKKYLEPEPVKKGTAPQHCAHQYKPAYAKGFAELSNCRIFPKIEEAECMQQLHYNLNSSTFITAVVGAEQSGREMALVQERMSFLERTLHTVRYTVRCHTLFA